jgi:hypothetical protein
MYRFSLVVYYFFWPVAALAGQISDSCISIGEPKKISSLCDFKPLPMYQTFVRTVAAPGCPTQITVGYREPDTGKLLTHVATRKGAAIFSCGEGIARVFIADSASEKQDQGSDGDSTSPRAVFEGRSISLKLNSQDLAKWRLSEDRLSGFQSFGGSRPRDIAAGETLRFREELANRVSGWWSHAVSWQIYGTQLTLEHYYELIDPAAPACEAPRKCQVLEGNCSNDCRWNSNALSKTRHTWRVTIYGNRCEANMISVTTSRVPDFAPEELAYPLDCSITADR